MAMKPNDYLFVYKNRGWPDKEITEKMKCSESRTKKIKETNEFQRRHQNSTCDINCFRQNDKTCIYVSRGYVHGYHYKHKQTKKRNLFVMVVNDGSWEAFVGNITLIP